MHMHTHKNLTNTLEKGGMLRSVLRLPLFLEVSCPSDLLLFIKRHASVCRCNEGTAQHRKLHPDTQGFVQIQKLEMSERLRSRLAIVCIETFSGVGEGGFKLRRLASKSAALKEKAKLSSGGFRDKLFATKPWLTP